MPASPPVDFAFLKWLRITGVVEGISTIVLFFVAMPLKYVGDMPIAVTIAGSIHGVLFMALVLMFAIGRERVPLPPKLVAWGVLGAIVPFGPFVVDRHLGRIGAPPPEAAAPSQA